MHVCFAKVKHFFSEGITLKFIGTERIAILQISNKKLIPIPKPV